MVKNLIVFYRKRLDSLFRMTEKVESNRDLTLQEKEKIFEGLFLDAFKNYEYTIEKLFIEAMLTREIIARKRFCSYVRPRNSNHAMDILLLEKDFIDWTNPESVIKRAEALFQNHSIITNCIKTNMQFLRDSKYVRNAITHSSEESIKQFNKVLNRYLGTKPVLRKTPGWFLNQLYTSNPVGITKVMKHFLNSYYNLSHHFV